LLAALAASSLGFLAQNAPPARMFMGDAGAYFIGMLFATVAVAGMHQGVPLTVTALPLAPFLLDGTFTIFRRLRRGEKIWQAHRSHLYQRAVQTGLGHRDVLLVYLAWIGACALAAIFASRDNAWLIAGWGVALLGLIVIWQWVLRREATLPPQTAS
jgi:UDP-N-acetylmuramyl pentapeptide phosphotransferase/UDP-N-acetylglucosamine-1-phosphate transferase